VLDVRSIELRFCTMTEGRGEDECEVRAAQGLRGTCGVPEHVLERGL
jgi:hypothetical protein